jgi:ABC-type Fe3+/spermidine/putrescine transport system ATPase subunit
MNALLTARNLDQVYGTTSVLSGVNVSVTPGQRLAVLGASGSGKTTLLRLFAGLDTPRAGAIERASSLTVGMVFQDLALWPNLSALENVALAVHSLPRAEGHTAAFAALESCHVADFAARLPGTLSIGQQQRVALARSIAARPDVLLLDEPFSSLDLVLKHELFATVRAVIADRALVLVTHDPLEALALCETALVLESGRVVEQGPLSELLAQPRSQLLRLFHEQLSSSRQ